ncbi:MAG: nuclear transport factor 2 family protein [Anaerolineae bacterium]|nr:nuclear transport factor 2 family protein [Anaerolineae bacterium]
MQTDYQQIITDFYTSFQKRDYAGMIACYHPQVTFSDPVFVGLKGKQAGAMWHMLCERSRDLNVTFNGVQVQGTTGAAHWEATYTFSTGRHVHNIIDAAFIFQDGKIIQHRDRFDFWRWTRMALGTSGVLLGWSPLVQNKVRQTGMGGLRVFIEKHPEYQE